MALIRRIVLPTVCRTKSIARKSSLASVARNHVPDIKVNMRDHTVIRPLSRAIEIDRRYLPLLPVYDFDSVNPHWIGAANILHTLHELLVPFRREHSRHSLIHRNRKSDVLDYFGLSLVVA